MTFKFNYKTFLTVMIIFASTMLGLSWLSLSKNMNISTYEIVKGAGFHSKFMSSFSNNDSSIYSKNDEDNSKVSTVSYDIVTLVHHSDMEPFINYGLRSWIIHLQDLPPDANIFLICNDQAYDAVTFHLQQEKLSGHQSSHNIIPVPEHIFPFTLKDVNDQQVMDEWHQSKPTWIYQQLLKLYSYQALTNYYNNQSLISNNKKSSKSNFKFIPQIKPWFTIIDSDTIFVQPISLFNYDQHKRMYVPIYNIASPQTGAFKNDADLGDSLIHEVFPTRTNITKAFPNHKRNSFTAITHFMIFNGQSVNHMIDAIYDIHNNTDTWKVLSRIKAVLSEWELYMAWIMNTKRDTIHVQQLPYINWGLLDHTNLIQLNNPNVSDIIYLSKHDDYQTHDKCCVNSYWHEKFGIEDCPCCQTCNKGMAINCHVLGMKGCREVATGLGNIPKSTTMSFDRLFVQHDYSISTAKGTGSKSKSESTTRKKNNNDRMESIRHHMNRHVKSHGYSISYNNQKQKD